MLTILKGHYGYFSAGHFFNEEKLLCTLKYNIIIIIIIMHWCNRNYSRYFIDRQKQIGN